MSKIEPMASWKYTLPAHLRCPDSFILKSQNSHPPRNLVPAQTGNFFLLPWTYFYLNLLLPPWRWKVKTKKSDTNVRVCTLGVCMLKWGSNREGDCDRERDGKRWDLFTRGPLSRAAFYRRQSSPWRHLKTDGWAALLHFKRACDTDDSWCVLGLITVTKQ